MIQAEVTRVSVLLAFHLFCRARLSRISRYPEPNPISLTMAHFLSTILVWVISNFHHTELLLIH